MFHIRGNPEGFIRIGGVVFQPFSRPFSGPEYGRDRTAGARNPDGVELSWSATQDEYAAETVFSLKPDAIWQAVNEPVASVGTRRTLSLAATDATQFFRLRSGVPGWILFAGSSPAPGEGDVAVTRETVVRFSAPLATDTMITGERMSAHAGGRRLLTRPELGSDGRSVTLFYQENLPAGTRVEVTLDGTGLIGAAGQTVDLDGDGRSGGAMSLQFETVNSAALPGTAIVGRVFASESGPNGANVPLAGVTITVDGREDVSRTVTAADGTFRLEPCPAGRFFVNVDGRTASASQWPSGAYYPVIGKGWEAKAGRTDNLAGGTGIIFLPLVSAGTLQPISATLETRVTFPPEVIEEQPLLLGVEIRVPPNGLFADDGTRGGLVGLAPVASDRLPEPLPAGLTHAIDISIQTSGPRNFDRPVPARFPNLPDPVTGVKLPPGAKTALWSFNHDIGRWEMQGPMTVTPDGNFAVTDPGVGIRQAGWHGTSPGSGGNGGPGGGGGGCPDGSGGLLAPGTSSGGGNCGCPEEPSESKIKEQECLARALECAMKCYEKCGSGGPISSIKKAFKLGYECKKAADCSLRCLEEGKRCKDHWQRCVLGGGGFRRRGLAPANVGEPAADPANQEALQILDDIDEFAPLWASLVAVMDKAPSFEELAPSDQALFDSVLARIDTFLGGRSVNEWAAARQARLARLVLQSSYADTLYPPVAGYYALQDMTSGLIRRGRTEQRGYLNGVILRPNNSYRIHLLLGSELVYHEAEFDSAGAGQPTFIPYGEQRAFSGVDADGDGLPAEAEFVLGTSDTNRDADGDGISDLEELRNHTDPLDGLPSANGVIAGLDTPGLAVDVALSGTVALVADSLAGVTVVDVTNPLRPFIIDQLDTPGTAGGVAIEGVRAAVADGTGGLVILDLSNSARPRIAATVPLSGSSQAVAVQDGIAYVGSGGGVISAVDMISGTALGTVILPGAAGVSDQVVQDGFLYVWAAAKLHVVELTGDGLAWRSSIDTQAAFATIEPVRRRIHAGPGRLYATHLQGVAVFDLPEPGQPVLVRRHDTTQTAWKQLVPALANFALAADGLAFTSAEPHDLSLYDLGPDGTELNFIATFPTPGLSHSLALYRGFAFVADGAAGLQVVNFLSPDTAGVPPTLTLAAEFPLDPPRIESGQRGMLTALAQDDVMVRQVDFYMDGVFAATDSTWPFRWTFLAPTRSPEVTAATLRIRAEDTAGNETWAELKVDLLPDQTPPHVVSVLPGPDIVADTTVRVVLARFSEPLDATTVSFQRVRLISAGADLVFGNSDDELVPGEVGYSGSAFAAQIGFSAPLPVGRYRFEVDGLRDLAGIVQVVPVVSQFWVAPGGPQGDADSDGLSNLQESDAGTNPFEEDTDGDGWADEVEVNDGSDPRDPASRPRLSRIARPPVALQVESLSESLPPNPGPVVARPPVVLGLLNGDEDVSGGPHLSRPPVAVMIEPATDGVPGPVFARPPVTMDILHASETAPAGPWIARPPVTLKLD